VTLKEVENQSHGQTKCCNGRRVHFDDVASRLTCLFDIFGYEYIIDIKCLYLVIPQHTSDCTNMVLHNITLFIVEDSSCGIEQYC